MIKDKIFKKCEGKRVLQVGVLGDFQNYLDVDLVGWDFKKISELASEAVGVDIGSEGVKILNDKGYKNIVFGDAEKLDFKGKFDVIYAGDIIEHLNNPGLFLESMKKHMHENSLLIITTPNPYSLSMIIKGILGTTESGIFEDHTTLFHKKTIDQLLSRHSLKIVKTEMFTLTYKKTFVTHMKSLILNLASKLNSKWHGSYYFEVSLI
ncbi:MAG: methyltransferase domain-containing protein [Methanobacteriota archaeon]